MKKRTLELELVGFCGFYETTAGDLLEQQIESDMQCVPSCFDVLNMGNWECWYTNDQAYRYDFAKRVMQDYLDLVVEKLKPIIHFEFTNDPVDMYSPLYRNYETDRVFKKVVVGKKGFNRLMSFLKRYPGFCRKVFENYFTDHSGYNSFYPNTLEYWFSRKFKTVTDLEFAYLMHCALCITLGSLDKYYNVIREYEDDAEMDGGFSYTEYIDEDQYKEDFNKALDNAGLIPCKEFVDDVIDSMRIYAMDLFTIQGNKIVLDK